MTTNTTRTEAIATLTAELPQGTTIYGIVRHVTPSGMCRYIDFYTFANGRPNWLSGHIRNLGEYKYDPDKHGLKIAGSGMDMIFAVAYELGRTLYGDGYALKYEQL